MRRRALSLLKAIATTVVGMIAAYTVALAGGQYVADITRTFKPAVSTPLPAASTNTADGQAIGRFSNSG